MLETLELLLATVLGKLKRSNPVGQISMLETWGTMFQVSEFHFDAKMSIWHCNTENTPKVDILHC